MTPENTLVLENKVDLETDLDGSKFLPELKHYSISAKH
jgi:hypothetical protein